MKDKQENANYRIGYSACAGTYADETLLLDWPDCSNSSGSTNGTATKTPTGAVTPPRNTRLFLTSSEPNTSSPWPTSSPRAVSARD